MLFTDRQDAGKRLAKELMPLANRQDVLVLALPRGGVILGYEISRQLQVPLDLIIVRKLGTPGQEELALGAIATNGIRIINKGIVESLDISPDRIEAIAAREQQELDRRNQLYRQGRPFPEVEDKIIILVDDGIATGATMRAAIKVLALMAPRQIIVSVPVASPTVYQELPEDNLKLLVLETPEPFFGIGMWYQDFPQVTDREVINCLENANDLEGGQACQK
jgi:putative phosphoribosyl transferase